MLATGETKCNYQLQRDYGFIVPGNPNDRIPLLHGSQPPSSASSSSNTAEASSSKSSISSGSGETGFSNAEASVKEVFSGHRLNGKCLVEVAGMTGDWTKGELRAWQAESDSDSSASSSSKNSRENSGSSSSSNSPSGPSSAWQDRWTQKGQTDSAFWSRQRSALLSLPLTDGYGGREGAASESEQEGGLAKGLLGWMAKPITDSGQPPPRGLNAEEVRVEMGAVQLHAQHMQVGW